MEAEGCGSLAQVTHAEGMAQDCLTLADIVGGTNPSRTPAERPPVTSLTPVGCGYSASLLTCSFLPRLRCRPVLVDQAIEDVFTPQFGRVEVSGSCR